MKRTLLIGLGDSTYSNITYESDTKFGKTDWADIKAEVTEACEVVKIAYPDVSNVISEKQVKFIERLKKEHEVLIEEYLKSLNKELDKISKDEASILIDLIKDIEKDEQSTDSKPATEVKKEEPKKEEAKVPDEVIPPTPEPEHTQEPEPVKTTPQQFKQETSIPEWAVELEPLTCEACNNEFFTYKELDSKKLGRMVYIYECDSCKKGHFVNPPKSTEPIVEAPKPIITPEKKASVQAPKPTSTPASNTGVVCKQCKGSNTRLSKKDYTWNGKTYDIYNCLDCPQINVKGTLRPVSTWIEKT